MAFDPDNIQFQITINITLMLTFVEDLASRAGVNLTIKLKASYHHGCSLAHLATLEAQS